MPLVDLSNPPAWHDNYQEGANQLWYSHELGVPVPPGRKNFTLGYCWFSQKFRNAQRALSMVTMAPILNGQSVVLAGNDFGWLAEAIQAILPASPIAVTDTSPWVHSVKGTDETAEITAWMDRDGITDPTERAEWLSRFVRPGPRAKVPVLDEDLISNPSRNRVKSALGIPNNANADWLITCNVLPWLTDNEATAMSDGGRLMVNNMLHMVTPFYSGGGQEPNPWNWKHIDSLEPTRPDLEAEAWYTTTSWKALLPNDLFMSTGNLTQVV